MFNQHADELEIEGMNYERPPWCLYQNYHMQFLRVSFCVKISRYEATDTKKPLINSL